MLDFVGNVFIHAHVALQVDSDCFFHTRILTPDPYIPGKTVRLHFDFPGSWIKV